MSDLGRFLRRCVGNRVTFLCPGCRETHVIAIGDATGQGGWVFNGDVDAPTFTPSILVTGSQKLSDAEADIIMGGGRIEKRPLRCHSYITDGQIQFLDDCSHGLAGQTVALPEWAEDAA